MSQSPNKLSRRTIFTGVATAGALGAAATLLPRAAQQAVPAPEVKEAPERGGGYQLTEHVQKYYKTTRL